MKKTLQRLGMSTVLGLASLAGTSGCSEFSSLWRPNEISSTAKQRRLFDFGKQIEKLYESGEKWTLDDKTNTLFVRGEHYQEAMDEFGIAEGDVYTNFYQGSKVKIKVLDTVVNPKDGTKSQITIATATGIVAGDRTFDTPFGDVKANINRANLDKVLTEQARTFYSNPKLEVVVNESEYPHSVGPNTYLGAGAGGSYDTPTGIIPVATTANTQFAALATPASDCKYVVDVKQTSNEATLVAKVKDTDENGEPLDEKAKRKIARQDPGLVDRVFVYGPTGNFTMGVYNRVPFNDGDLFVGLGNRPLDNFNAFVGKVNQTLCGILDLTAAYRQGRMDIDFMTHETVYLESHLANNKGNKIERATNKLNQLGDLQDAAKRVFPKAEETAK
jgi:hypothetical protein